MTYLYHGSDVPVTVLEPRLASPGSRHKGHCVVYASHERAYATAFALPFVPDQAGGLTWSLAYKSSAPHITLHAGSLDLTRIGYLYRVPATSFHRVDEFQWVSTECVAPLDHQEIRPAEYAHWVVSPLVNGRLSSTERVQTPTVDFESLQAYLVANYLRPVWSIHGPQHWQRVERNGLLLSNTTGANIEVVRLFAFFHDYCRLNDGTDEGHGERGAELAWALRGKHFDLSDDAFEVLRVACTWHSEGFRHDDPTVGTCWDADRLDLSRVGVLPNPRFMSTSAGRKMAIEALESTNWVCAYGGC